MIKKIILTIIVSNWAFLGFSQYFPKKQYENKVKEELFKTRINSMGFSETSYMLESKKEFSLILRKSVQDYFADKNSKLAKKGALFALTKPKDKSTSIAINAGLIVSYLGKGVTKVVKGTGNEKKFINKYIKSTFSSYIQYDKNTLIDKEQSNILIGLGYTDNFINYKKFKETYGIGEKRLNAPIKFTGSYRKDYENDLEAFQSTFLLLPRLFEINEREELTRANWLGKRDYFDFDISLGLEYDYRFNSENKFLDGNLLRSFSSIKFQIKRNKRFITTLDWHYRYVLANSTSLIKNDFSLLIFKIEYKPKLATYGKLLESIEPVIGIIHENGENPTNGFDNQSYWALSLSLKI